MKKSFFIVLILISGLPVYAQEHPELWEVIDSLPRSQVPRPVQTAFRLKYPGIRPIFWFQLNDDYEAQFTMQEKSVSAEFNKTGRWINTEIIIPEEEFPVKVLDYVRQFYSNYELDTVILEESPVGRFYDVTLANQEADEELIFDIRGNFLRKAEQQE